MVAVPDLAFIEAMERAVKSGDRAAAARYLAPDIVYAVGARKPIRGIDAVFAHVEEQARLARWDGHTLQGAWSVENALIVEVISHFTRAADGKRISFPCTDIYRFSDSKILDWRVYADMSPFTAI